MVKSRDSSWSYPGLTGKVTRCMELRRGDILNTEDTSKGDSKLEISYSLYILVDGTRARMLKTICLNNEHLGGLIYSIDGKKIIVSICFVE